MRTGQWLWGNWFLGFLDKLVVRSTLKICWFLAISLLFWAPGARAQKPVQVPVAGPEQDAALPAAAEAKPWQKEAGLRPAAPDVYLLPDESGKLRRVLGFKYEDFRKAWKSGDPATPVSRPRYVLDFWEITGEVLETHARIRIELKITPQATGWADIPLQLPAFIVQRLTISDQAEGECLVFDQGRFGHVVWLMGKPGQQRTLILEGLARLKLNTSRHSLELHVPRATSSKFTIRVPSSFTQFESSPESTLSTTVLDADTSEVRLVGQANPLRLSWKPTEEKGGGKASLIEVEGVTRVHLDRRRIRYTTTLQINSFGRLLEQIQVRLPRGAKLVVSDLQGDYEVSEVSTTLHQNERRVVEIRRPPLQTPPQAKPWSVRLAAEQPLDVSAEEKIEGFEVIDAIRQSGTLLLEVDNRKQAYFEPNGDIDQIRLPEAATATEGRWILGHFRYSRFPWQLAVFTSPRQRRVSAQPKYELSLSSEEAHLNVTYDYQFTGAQISRLRINLQDWKLTDSPIDSGGLVDPNGIIVTREKTLILPLVGSGVQKLRLNFKLRKDLELSKNVFFLPEALGAFSADGELVVDSSESLIVIPKFDEMVGLSLITKASGDSSVRAARESDAEKEFIHLRSFLARPKFVAEVKQRQRQLTAIGETSVEVTQPTIRVRQRINYESKYRSVSQLSLSLPEEMWLNESLTVSLDGNPLPFGLGTSLSGKPLEKTAANEAMSLRQMIVSLPRPMQNNIPVDIAYEIPAPLWSAGEWTPIRLPLVAPLDTLNRHTAVIQATKPVLVTANQRPSTDAWQRVADGKSVEDSSVLRLQTKEKISFLTLHAQVDLAKKVELATLERAWIQSWVTKGQRQERAVFRFRTTHATVVVQLPRDLEHTEIELLLDRKPCPHELLDNHRLAVALPSSGQGESHTLELRYQTSASLPGWGKLHFSLPRLECHLANAPIYWQLVLPQGWLLTNAPKQLTPDYWIGWKNYRWGRQPTHMQAYFEQFSYGESSVAPPQLSTEYVFRSFEFPAEIRIVVLRQAWLLLACSLVAFGAGLLCLYTTLARRGVFWLVLALILLAGVFSFPELALLAIEVILAAGLMVFVTSVLRQFFAVKVYATAPTTQHQFEPATESAESWGQPPLLAEDAAPTETTATLPTSGPSP